MPAGAVHLRTRDGGEQATTVVELFFDLVFVFAITQVSHVLIEHLEWAYVAKAGFLLLVLWWAWVNTTWMVNWFDPGSPPVRLVLVAAMLASLLMAAALPEAFGPRGLIFAGAYVALQVGRNLAGALLLSRDDVLSGVLQRLLAWSVLAGVLWIAGAVAPEDVRFAFWGPALGVELLAPLVGYRTPGLGVSHTDDYDVEGGHFAERVQAFIIIALGESLVVTGATAADTGLITAVVLALCLAFLGTAALWWLYFGKVAEVSRRDLATSSDTSRLARDAYTYLHLPIVAGVILAAVGDDLLITHHDEHLHGVGALAVLGGPALFLVGEGLFRLRMIGRPNIRRLVVAAVLVALVPVAPEVPTLALGAAVASLLTALALTEQFLPAGGSAEVLAT